MKQKEDFYRKFLYSLKKNLINMKLSLKGNVFFFFIWSSLKGTNHLLVKKTSILCIDSYPRCANTFSYLLFKEFLPHFSIGHHTHSVANLKLAMKYRIPIVVIVREPSEAIASYILREQVSLERAIIEYIWFHEFVMSHRDDIIIVDFLSITKKPLKVFKNVLLKISSNSKLLTVDSASILEKISNVRDIELKEKIFALIDKNFYKWNKNVRTKKDYAISIPTSLKKEVLSSIKNKVIRHPDYPKCHHIYYCLKRFMI